MAKLIKDDEQVKACKEINDALDELRKINARIVSKEPIVIAVGNKQTIQLEDKFTEKVAAILKAQRQNVIKDIQQKSKKFRIALEDDEKALMSDAITVPMEKPEKQNAAAKKASSVDTVVVPETDEYDEEV